jgi:hypothetical protein
VLRELLVGVGVAVAGEPRLLLDGALWLVPEVAGVVEVVRFDLHLGLGALEGWEHLPLLLA